MSDNKNQALVIADTSLPADVLEKVNEINKLFSEIQSEITKIKSVPIRVSGTAVLAALKVFANMVFRNRKG